MIDLEPIRQSVKIARQLPPDFISQSQRNVMALLEEVDRLRRLLDYRNREPPHCPTCDCGDAHQT